MFAHDRGRRWGGGANKALNSADAVWNILSYVTVRVKSHVGVTRLFFTQMFQLGQRKLFNGGAFFFFFFIIV